MHTDKIAGRFLTRLELEYIDGRRWMVTRTFVYDRDGIASASGFESNRGQVITVPCGFVTDFASIPRACWDILPPTGEYGEAAVIHDYLYANGGLGRYSRAECDHIFLEAMEALGVGWLVRNTMYRAVRAFGHGNFRNAGVRGQGTGDSSAAGFGGGAAEVAGVGADAGEGTAAEG
jgi:hypothetical protein